MEKQKKTIVLLELTCAFDNSATSFMDAFDRKTDRYDRLTLNCEGLGYTAYNTPWEMSAKDVFTGRNLTVMAMVANI